MLSTISSKNKAEHTLLAFYRFITSRTLIHHYFTFLQIILGHFVVNHSHDFLSVTYSIRAF